ncbi:MAG: hypothetical protein HY075_05220 [Deltaproteobacteria bacterium]|nr:hypothetical protein [Deltaproteobacteria bacterium]
MLLTCWVLALIAVVAVSAAVFGFAALARGLFPEARSPEALGLGIFTSVLLVTGIAGAYNVLFQSALVFGGLAFLALSPEYWRGRLKDLRRHLPRGRDWLWLGFPAVYFVTRFFSCGLPQQHSDPLYYHLSAPQLWAELGRITITPEHPSFAQAALWETLYGIPQLWFGTRGASAHVITQLYGQWMHMFWGQGGTLLLAALLLARLAPPLERLPGLTVFVAWLCTTQPVFEWLGCLAKNDYVLCVFVLGAVLEALDERWWLAGFFIGLAYSTKVLAAWAALALVVFIPPRRWPRYVAGAALSAAPFLLRNLIATRNPLFPNLDDVLGPHWVSSWWMNHNATFGGGPRFDPRMFRWLSEQMFMKALPKLLLGAGAAAFAVEAWRRHSGKSRETKLAGLHRRRWLVFLGIQFVLAFTMLRPLADGRYGNYVAILMTVFASACVLREAARDRRVWRYGAPVLLALGALVNSPVDVLWKIPRDYWFEPAVHYVEQFHPCYDVQRWIQINVPPKDQVLFFAEKEQFYLDRDWETVSEMKKWDELLTPIKTADELFEVLRGRGYRYAHFSPQAGGYPGVIRPYWNTLVAREREAVYRSPTSLVFKIY